MITVVRSETYLIEHDGPPEQPRRESLRSTGKATRIFSGVTQWIRALFARRSAPVCSAARTKGALESVERSPDWLNLTLAQLLSR